MMTLKDMNKMVDKKMIFIKMQHIVDAMHGSGYDQFDIMEAYAIVNRAWNEID